MFENLFEYFASLPPYWHVIITVLLVGLAGFVYHFAKGDIAQ